MPVLPEELQDNLSEQLGREVGRAAGEGSLPSQHLSCLAPLSRVIRNHRPHYSKDDLYHYDKFLRVADHVRRGAARWRGEEGGGRAPSRPGFTPGKLRFVRFLGMVGKLGWFHILFYSF